MKSTIRSSVKITTQNGIILQRGILVPLSLPPPSYERSKTAYRTGTAIPFHFLARYLVESGKSFQCSDPLDSISGPPVFPRIVELEAAVLAVAPSPRLLLALMSFSCLRMCHSQCSYNMTRMVMTPSKTQVLSVCFWPFFIGRVCRVRSFASKRPPFS